MIPDPLFRPAAPFARGYEGHPPHAATAVQPKPAPGQPVARPPHAAMVMQRQAAPAAQPARAPHPATVAQPRQRIGGRAPLPPHPATVAQRREALQGRASLPPDAAKLPQQQSRSVQVTEPHPAVALPPPTVQRATAAAGPAPGGSGNGASGGSGGGGGRKPLPSQEAEFAGKSNIKGLVVTHAQLQAQGFVQMGSGAGWLFTLDAVGLRIHAYGRELEDSRFMITGFAFGQHNDHYRPNLPYDSRDFKDWTDGSGPFKF